MASLAFLTFKAVKKIHSATGIDLRKQTDREIDNQQKNNRFWYAFRKLTKREKTICASQNKTINELREVENNIKANTYALEKADLIYANRYKLLEDLVDETVEEVFTDDLASTSKTDIQDLVNTIAKDLTQRSSKMEQTIEEQVNFDLSGAGPAAMALPGAAAPVLTPGLETREDIEKISAQLEKELKRLQSASDTTKDQRAKVFKRTIKDSVYKAERRALNTQKSQFVDALANIKMEQILEEEPYLEEGVAPLELHPFPLDQRGIIYNVGPAAVSTSMQTDTTNETTECVLTQEQEKFASGYSKTQYVGPKFKIISRFAHKAKWVKYYERLTRFLNIKYHMSIRNYTTYRYMLQDARTWMMKNGFTCDTEYDYHLITNSVNAAFIIQAEELETREIIKDTRNLDAMEKINKFAGGELGNVPTGGLFGCLRSKKAHFGEQQKLTC